MIRNKNEEHFKANQGPERGGNLHSANLYLLKQWLMLGSQSWWSEGILMQRKKSLMSDIGPFIGFPLRVHSLPLHSLYKNIQYKEKKSKDLDLPSGGGDKSAHSAIFVPQAYFSVSSQMTMSPEEIMKQKNCIESWCSWLDGFSFCSLKIVSLRVEGASE